MKKLLSYCILSLLLLFSVNGEAQDTLKQVFRPRIGLGTGIMTYYGEVQNYQRNFTPTVNKIGGLVFVNAPISKAFNLEFSANYTKIASNERSLYRNFNFESRIRMGTVLLYYNFYPLFDKNRTRFHPFIGAGFSSFEFLSKTDLYDVNGNQYHYWSDGSIMNMAENDPGASDASPLVRDYTYETDLRELNADDLGKYREQSVSFPLSIGAEWHMSPRWDFRFAMQYNFTFTDLIDNVSSAGTGIREGDPKNDKLLFTYVSLSYDLKFGRDAEGEGPNVDEEGIPLYAEWDPNDYDKDGVIDALDQCPATPLEALVDEFGCPLDGDKDGVPDYRDDELDTKLDTYVNEFGVTLTEDDLAEHARRFNDSTGYDHEFTEFRTEVSFNRQGQPISARKSKAAKTGLKYVIVVGKERRDVTVNDLHKFLGYNEYSSVVKGDTVYYTIGEFSSIQDAVAAKNSFTDAGVFVEEIGRNSGDGERIIPVDNKVVKKVEQINVEEGRVPVDINSPNQIYRIQIGAFSKKVDTEEAFPGIDVVYGASNNDNLNRYYTTAFTSYEEAEAYRKKLIASGYNGAFVVAYEKQERVTLVEAGVPADELPPDYDEAKEIETFVEPRTTDSTATDSLNYDPKKVIYRVQLAYFADEIPVETVDKLYNIQNIKPIKSADGSTTYYSRPFNTAEEREAALDELKTYKLDELKMVIEYEGEFYTDEEFQAKFGN